MTAQSIFDDDLGLEGNAHPIRVESSTIFVQAGRLLHELYLKGIEDALAYYLDGAIYVVHSRMKSTDHAFRFTENATVLEKSVDQVVIEGQSDERKDVTAKCLNAFSGRYR